MILFKMWREGADFQKNIPIKLILKQNQKNFIFFIDKYSVNKYIKKGIRKEHVRNFG